MKVTKAAKEEFPKNLDDLYARGARLIRQSVEHGVTAMRAHVEIDTSVGFTCLETALKLQSDFRAHCDLQIASTSVPSREEARQIPNANF
jgi:cytosine/adenosine deaminase-related metal-dependent hydrolase